MTRFNAQRNLLITPYNGDQQHDWQDLIFRWHTQHNGANNTTGSTARCGTTSHFTGPSSAGVTHCVSPDNGLQPRRTSPRLSGQEAAQNGLTRLQPYRISTPLQTTDCPGRTHSSAATPDLSTPLRTRGCRRRTHSSAATLDLSAPFRTRGCPGRTHSFAATPDLSAPLRTRGCPGRTHSSAASSDLHASPDDRLPRTDSLVCSTTGSLCASSPANYPGTQTPVAGRQRHIASDRLAPCRTDPARHRQHNSPTPQNPSIPVVSLLPISSPKPSSPRGG